ncbi:MAG: glucose 1-dehydrogenase [Myxococcales bacterium]|nr:glucose 1-dehydrogenase [Myxococcales bacterium]
MSGMHEDSVALVTGAGSGIGRAAAEIFAREGARVVVADRNAEAGNETVEIIRKAGGDAAFSLTDVSDEASVAAMVKFAVDTYGALDSAMNNAGISDAQDSFHEMGLDVWERMVGINLTGVFLCMKHEIVQMLSQEAQDGRRGAIVNTASGAGIVPAPGQPHYTAAKHGVLGLTKVAAAEYYTRGIRANAICPGITDTPMLREAIRRNPESEEPLLATVPGNTPGRPEDVAGSAVWLCSEGARWVNGQSLIVDGGGVMR